MKTGKMFVALEETGRCMKGNGSPGDAPPSCEMELVLRFEQILIFVEEQGSKNFQLLAMFVL